ncbi:Acetyl esterase/lipase [Neorhodopirellula lusitana]|uniref:Acetyl esterase/lipase n=1 Tax=Neorhodopirellula lusitana TaxID=445327 RepID=A0ABY1PQP7_9BACT|nr:alpha/beta hydrolase [Neorhodopirellula lusitana]SMP38198.1 Acetyl esterase/lipase [Neorhodopirellula lusitana]
MLFQTGLKIPAVLLIALCLSSMTVRSTLAETTDVTNAAVPNTNTVDSEKSRSKPTVIELWTDAELASSSEGGIQSNDSEHTQDRGGGNTWVTKISRPTLTVYSPDANSSGGSSPSDSPARGTAVVVCPGGGYGGLAIEKEGHEVARWLTTLGVTAGVLKYRCGGGANAHPVPLSDARQAVGLLRSQAKQWNIDPQRVGIIGFSAGGHLAATIATDEATGINFAGLIYPVISMADGVTHNGSRKNLLGQSPDEKLVHQMSRDEQVTAATCPTFLVHASDDRGVSVQNSLRFYSALQEHSVPAELHVFDQGGHGFGMYRGDRPCDQWPDQFKAWMKLHGWLN